jgi:hypothetical protein
MSAAFDPLAYVPRWVAWRNEARGDNLTAEDSERELIQSFVGQIAKGSGQ